MTNTLGTESSALLDFALGLEPHLPAMSMLVFHEERLEIEIEIERERQRERERDRDI